MDMVLIIILMEINTKDNLKMTNMKVMDFQLTKMEKDLGGNGKIMNLMDMQLSIFQMELKSKDNGQLAR